MTARRMPKYPFTKKERAENEGGLTGGAILTVIPLLVLVLLIAGAVLSPLWRAAVCSF